MGRAGGGCKCPEGKGSLLKPQGPANSVLGPKVNRIPFSLLLFDSVPEKLVALKHRRPAED